MLTSLLRIAPRPSLVVVVSASLTDPHRSGAHRIGFSVMASESGVRLIGGMYLPLAVGTSIRTDGAVRVCDASVLKGGDKGMAGKERETLSSKHCALILDVVQRARDTTAWPPDGDWLEDAQLVLEMAELMDNSRRVGRVVEDAGELTPHAVRLLRDFERQLPGVLSRWYAWAIRTSYIEEKQAAA